MTIYPGPVLISSVQKIYKCNIFGDEAWADTRRARPPFSDAAGVRRRPTAEVEPSRAEQLRSKGPRWLAGAHTFAKRGATDGGVGVKGGMGGKEESTIRIAAAIRTHTRTRQRRRSAR